MTTSQRARSVADHLGVRGQPVRLWPAVVVCSLAAVLSLVLPSTLTYDSWSWLTWGRELARLDLDTSGFVAAWKPLPVLIAAVLSFAGPLAPALWLVVARAGGLLAVVMAFRLAHRISGFTGGAVAAVAVLSSAGFTGYLLPLGMSEPLLGGLALAAVERHLDGRHLHACMLVYAASLLRPEVWPFLGLYVLWLWRGEPRRRALTCGLVALLPVLWLGPDLLGSGDAFRSFHRAAVPTQGGPLLSDHPGISVIRDAGRYLPLPLGLAAVVAVVVAFADGRRRRFDRATLTILGVTAAWLIIEVILTQAGRSSGDRRYLIVAAAGASVLAGIGCGHIVNVGRRLAARVSDDDRLVQSGQVAASMILVAAMAPPLLAVVRRLGLDARDLRYQEALSNGLPAAVQSVGGRNRVVACGSVYGGFYQAPLLAWQLRLNLGAVQPTTAPAGVEQRGSTGDSRAAADLARFVTAVPRAPGTVFASRVTRTGVDPPDLPATGSGFSEAASVGRWSVASSCAASPGR